MSQYQCWLYFSYGHQADLEVFDLGPQSLHLDQQQSSVMMRLLEHQHRHLFAGKRNVNNPLLCIMGSPDVVYV